MKLGNAIKRLRGLRGLRQEDLAAKIKVSKPYISMLESGKRDPSLKMLKDIAKALGCSMFLITFLAEDHSAESLPASRAEAALELLKIACT